MADVHGNDASVRRETQPRTPHILGTASNLLGFCLLVQTSTHLVHRSTEDLVDEATTAASLLFTTACMLSFLSMRTKHQRRSDRLERLADGLFIGGLILVFIIIVMIAISMRNTAPGDPLRP